MDTRLGKALFMVKAPVDRTDFAIGYCNWFDLELEIFDGKLSHDDFLAKLLTVEYYLDLKGITNKDVLSVSGIEALEQGCKVVVDTGEVVTEFKTTTFLDYQFLYQREYLK